MDHFIGLEAAGQTINRTETDGDTVYCYHNNELLQAVTQTPEPEPAERTLRP